MHSFKLSSVLVFLLFLIATSTNGQSKAENLSDEQKAELAASLEEYQAALDLTDDQSVKFEEITRKYAGQMKEVKDGGGGKVQKVRKVKSIQNNKNAEMKELLSADQYKVYLDKQEEMQKKMKAKRKG